MGLQTVGHNWVTELNWSPVLGLPRWFGGKEPACQCRSARDIGSIPESGKSPGGGMSTHSTIFSWEIPWTEEIGGLQSTGSQRVGHDWSDLALTHILMARHLSTTAAGKCYCLHTASWLAFYPLAVCFNPSATLNAHPKLPEKTRYVFNYLRQFKHYHLWTQICNSTHFGLT